MAAGYHRLGLVWLNGSTRHKIKVHTHPSLIKKGGAYGALRVVAMHRGCACLGYPYCVRHTKYSVPNTLASLVEVWLSGHRWLIEIQDAICVISYGLFVNKKLITSSCISWAPLSPSFPFLVLVEVLDYWSLVHLYEFPRSNRNKPLELFGGQPPSSHALWSTPPFYSWREERVIHDCMIVGPTQRRLNYLYLVVDIDSYVVARVGRATMFIISCYSGAYIFIVVESTRVHVIRYDIVGKWCSSL